MKKDRPRFSAACPSSLYINGVPFPGPRAVIPTPPPWLSGAKMFPILQSIAFLASISIAAKSVLGGHWGCILVSIGNQKR